MSADAVASLPDAQPSFAPHLREVRDFVTTGEPPEFNPLNALARVLRGRWLGLTAATALSAATLGTGGFLAGSALYESKAIIRISAREPGILYATGDDSRLKLFEAFVKGETTYVASHEVMERATNILVAAGAIPPETTLSAKDLSESVEVARKDALIVVTSASRDPAFAAAKANSVVEAYLALHSEGEVRRASYRERELSVREKDLEAKLGQINARTLEVGGEYGMSSLVKAHIEKVAQLEALSQRRAEVASTLAAMEARTSLASADMGDVEIKRATLLDRALADLTFDKTKREAELSTLLRRYTPESPEVRRKRLEIEVVDRAIAERRDQIAVLGRTGALTDATAGSEEESVSEIKALLAKVTEQIEVVRADARALNGKRIELDFLEEERAETRRMLDETRHALDVIRVESRNALPGLVEVMSSAPVPERPAKNTRKMMGAAGVIGGGMLAAALYLGIAVMRGRVRYSDDLWRLDGCAPLLRVCRAPRPDETIGERDVDRLATAIQLLPVPGSVQGAEARVILVGATGEADSASVARALAASFARCGLETLLIDADVQKGRLTDALGLAERPGWREILAGRDATLADVGGFRVLAVGQAGEKADHFLSVRSVREALRRVRGGAHVVLLDIGELDAVAAEPVAAAADLALAVIRPGDQLATVDRLVRRAGDLARNGAAGVFVGASRRDPGLTG